MARLTWRRAAGLAALGVAAAAFAIVVVGRPGHGDLPTPIRRPQPPARSAELVAMRERDVRLCRASRLLRPTCPRRVPAALYPRAGAYVAPHGRGVGRYDRFDLIALPTRAGPSHLALFASRFGLDPLFSSPQRRLGRALWGGRRGRVLLDRSRPDAGDHVVFRWRTRGIEYAAALSVWGSVRSAVATLRAVVTSGP